MYTSDYDLYIQNLSESSIFVQSRNLNYNMHQEQTTVCRVPAHSAAVCVFSNIVFQQVSWRVCVECAPLSQLLSDAPECENAGCRGAARSTESLLHPSLVCERSSAPFPLSYVLVPKVCFEGWGPDYPRQDVTSTPCWLEIQLLYPLWVGSFLFTINGF